MSMFINKHKPFKCYFLIWDDSTPSKRQILLTQKPIPKKKPPFELFVRHVQWTPSVMEVKFLLLKTLCSTQMQYPEAWELPLT